MRKKAKEQINSKIVIKMQPWFCQLLKCKKIAFKDNPFMTVVINGKFNHYVNSDTIFYWIDVTVFL